MTCKNCGAVLPEDAKFCGKCGTMFSQNNISRSNTIAPSISVQETKPSAVFENITASYQSQQPKEPYVNVAVKPKSNSSMRIVVIVSSALLICTIGIITLLFMLNGSGKNMAIPDTAGYISSAEKYLLEMNYEQAIIEFDKVLAVDPMNVDAYLGKAEALLATGKTDEAIVLLEEAYSKTGNPQIFEKLQSLRQPPVSSSSSEIVTENLEQIEIESKDPVYQDPMCLAIEKTLTDYLNGKPITDTTNFDKVTDLYILGTKVYVACGNRYGTGQMGGWGLSPDKITYSLYIDNSGNYVNLEETSGPLTDISFIKEMKKLKKLHIDCQRNLKDISPLSGMSSIKTIILDRNGIVDISPLANMTQLISLHLFHNSISDISAVKNMKNLLTLYFGNNNISNISAVAGLTNLKNLWISENPIYDISAVSELTQLKQFIAGECGFSDISSLSNLTALDDVSLDNNNISDIIALSNCKNIEKLYLYKNKITDISALSNLTNLTRLALSSNSIYNVSPLYNLTKLEYLSLGGNYASESDVEKLEKALGLEINYWQNY